MRDDVDPKLEAGKHKAVPFRHLTGGFIVRGPCGEELKIVSSTGDEPGCQGWEHVSISCRKRCPNWLEMAFVKDLFWKKDEMCVQYHPVEDEYVNNHSYCLHIWRHISQVIPKPPMEMVGIKDLGTLKK